MSSKKLNQLWQSSSPKPNALKFSRSPRPRESLSSSNNIQNQLSLSEKEGLSGIDATDDTLNSALLPSPQEEVYECKVLLMSSGLPANEILTLIDYLHKIAKENQYYKAPTSYNKADGLLYGSISVSSELRPIIIPLVEPSATSNASSRAVSNNTATSTYPHKISSRAKVKIELSQFDSSAAPNVLGEPHWQDIASKSDFLIVLLDLTSKENLKRVSSLFDRLHHPIVSGSKSPTLIVATKVPSRESDCILSRERVQEWCNRRQRIVNTKYLEYSVLYGQGVRDLMSLIIEQYQHKYNASCATRDAALVSSKSGVPPGKKMAGRSFLRLGRVAYGVDTEEQQEQEEQAELNQQRVEKWQEMTSAMHAYIEENRSNSSSESSAEDEDLDNQVSVNKLSAAVLVDGGRAQHSSGIRLLSIASWAKHGGISSPPAAAPMPANYDTSTPSTLSTTPADITKLIESLHSISEDDIKQFPEIVLVINDQDLNDDEIHGLPEDAPSIFSFARWKAHNAKQDRSRLDARLYLAAMRRAFRRKDKTQIDYDDSGFGCRIS